ncbi:sulfur oxidation c-type cytochrome SoxA [Xanthobacteraceae bacterium Astr-EGSB]|uniref:sulfur oxidation c-type cytochrome SoxA n=1 Tax=Astrobacterium formosum TaxID=3069710 RepID=UPI0027B1BAF9|nr:sulfur oxidation c-type cytochrome SoxA [Xanthobacteraceae bacterium Astr-EGSB]
MIFGLGRAAGIGLLAAIVTAPAIAAGPSKGEPAPLDMGEAAAARPWKRYGGWPKRDMSKFNTLAKHDVSPPGPTEPRKLPSPITGDPDKGAKLVADRSRGGSCLACHVMGQAGKADLPGNVGPDLSEIGNAGRDDEWLFNYVYDARVYNPETIMIPWGSHGLFNDEEIGHMVAFLKTLKAPAKFPTALDDPTKRPPPVETRDNLDPFVNEAMTAVERAETLFAAKGPSGSACVTCHADAKASFSSWAAHMPKWEPRLAKVMGVEEFITRHAKATTGATWLMQSDENLAMAVYLRHIANGEMLAVDTSSPEAKAAVERGKKLTTIKLGQLNLACMDCHSAEKGGLKWIRGQWLGEQRGQLDHFPTWRTSLLQIWDIRKRFQWCQVNIRADELPPDAKEYGDLELFLASANAGLKMNVPGIRH